MGLGITKGLHITEFWLLCFSNSVIEDKNKVINIPQSSLE